MQGARQGMVEIAGQARKKKIPAFLSVNNRLEGNAPSTIEAVADELVARTVGAWKPYGLRPTRQFLQGDRG
jgi:hypothetical protein